MTCYRVIKRLIDVVFSLLAIIFFSPILVIISFAVFIESGFPIIFRQNRVGLSGSSFKIFKFRTMVNNQPIHSYDYVWSNGVPDDFIFKTPKSNITIQTKVGAFLRKFSLDELPQLFNVLFGTMSLVGPRPEIPEIARFYNSKQIKRLTTKPGITGVAQIRGRSSLTHGEKIKYDLKYIEYQCISLDLIIIGKTFFRVVKGSDAF